MYSLKSGNNKIWGSVPSVSLGCSNDESGWELALEDEGISVAGIHPGGLHCLGHPRIQ